MKARQIYLALGHIVVIIMSNLLVMYPFTIWGLHTTWGAFGYPLLFILTDLTTRILGSNTARQVVFTSMFPALIISYLIATYFSDGQFQDVPLRVAMGSFTAYVIGQLLDITVFQRFRQTPNWWLAPAISITLASIVDTYIFFTIAFYHCTDPILSQHWLEIANVDLTVKLIINLLGVVPLYGALLQALTRRRAATI